MASVDLAINWLSLESVLIDRIRDQVKGLAEVGGAWEHDRLLMVQPDEEMAIPAAYVLYGGHVTAVNPKGRGVRLVDQFWTVRLITRPDPPAKTDSIQKGGALLSRLILALENWPATPDDLRGIGIIEPIEDISSDEDPTLYAGGVVVFQQVYRARLALNHM